MVWLALERQIYLDMTFHWMAGTSGFVLTLLVLLSKISQKEVTFFPQEVLFEISTALLDREHQILTSSLGICRGQHWSLSCIHVALGIFGGGLAHSFTFMVSRTMFTEAWYLLAAHSQAGTRVLARQGGEAVRRAYKRLGSEAFTLKTISKHYV